MKLWIQDHDSMWLPELPSTTICIENIQSFHWNILTSEMLFRHWFSLLLFSCFLVVSSSMFPFLIIAHCLASEAKKQSENCRVFIKVSSSSLADSINEIIFQQSTLLSGPLTPPPSQRQVKGGSADGNVFSPNIRGRWSVIARSPPPPPLLPLPREVTVCV